MSNETVLITAISNGLLLDNDLAFEFSEDAIDNNKRIKIENALNEVLQRLDLGSWRVEVSG